MSLVAPRIDIEPWSPEYGAPVEAEALAPTDADVDASVELPLDAWRPIAPDAAATPAPERVSFIDGVRRIDARVWITTAAGARPGICASYAAGVVRCDGSSAHVAAAEVRRGLLAHAGALELHTRAGTYHPLAVAADDVEKLMHGLQERMTLLEREVAERELRSRPDVLLVTDGPLTAKLDLRGAVGYVKTHRVAYLPPEVAGVIAALEPAQRSPIFITQGAWSRYGWYLRLARTGGHPWSGIVRCEASADLALDDARRRADQCAVTLPRFASAPHKDPRAPQNLYPIAALERDLRRRMGDAAWVYRALKIAVAGA